MKALKTEYKISADSYDPWGTYMGWLFAIAGYQTDIGDSAPHEWDYRAGIGGSDTDSHEYQTLVELNPTIGELKRFGALLWRYRSMLEAAGKSY